MKGLQLSAAWVFALLSISALASDPPIFTFGPATNYDKTASITASPTSRDLLVLPTNLANQGPVEGIDFFFGPDLQTELHNVLGEVCTKGLTQDCINGLSARLDPYEVAPLQARFAPVIALAVVGVAVVLQIFIIWTIKPDQAVPAVHLESTDIVQLKSQTATSFVFSTPSATAPFTITSIPYHTVADATATITTLTIDEGGYHKGDVRISIPTEPARLFKDIIQQVGGYDRCKNETQDPGDRPALANIDIVANFALPVVAPRQAFDGLGIRGNQVLPAFSDESSQQALEAFQANAATTNVFQGVAQDLVKAISGLIFMDVYRFCTDPATDLSAVILPAIILEQDIEAGQKECPNETDEPLCPDTACLGVDSVCTVGPHKGCHCLNVIKVHMTPGTPEEWDENQQFIVDTLKGLDGTPKCDSGEHFEIKNEDYERIVETLCKDVNLGNDFARDITPADAGLQGSTPFTFSAKWTHAKDSCSFLCTTIFNSFVDSVPCTSDDHSMPMSATFDTSCGKATYEFEHGSKNAAGGDSQYVNLGNLDCGQHTDMGNAVNYVDLEMMNKAAKFFCQKQIEKSMKWILETEHLKNEPVELHYNNHNFDPVYLSMKWINDPGCPVTDFSGPNAMDMCLDRFSTIINGCDTKNEKGLKWWKQGGSFFRDCISWTIRRDEWRISDGLGGPVSNDPSWSPNTGNCENPNVCAAYSKPCIDLPTPVWSTCIFDKEHTDLGWCKCEGT